MRLAIIILVGVIVGLVLMVGIVALIGSRLPKTHVASRSLLLHKSPEEVYAVVRDLESAPKWRTDLTRVQVTKQPDGGVHFEEQGGQGTVNYALEEDVPQQRMVTRILDQDLDYSGRWLYAFASENGGTRVTITEESEVSNVLFRFMSRYIFGHTATLDSYLTSLAKRFGEDAKPQ
jgi:uncharacterized membrane protein